MDTLLVTLCALAILVGLVGVAVPVLPGLSLCYAAVIVWAIFAHAGWGKWAVLGICTLWALIGTVVKYAWPGRRMKRAGVPSWSVLAGVALGLLGFFLIPVVGLPIGFVGGVWLAEWGRHKDARLAWPSTVEALKATGLSMLVELGAALLIAVTWVAGAFVA